MSKFFFSDFEIEVSEDVYEPRDDSILMAETLMKMQLHGKKALDVGTGSGLQSIVLAKKGFHVLAVDINKNALKNVELNAENLSLSNKIQTCESDLFSNVNETFDVIVFNPPYVESDEIKWEAVDGGSKGREILDRFLNKFADYLNPNGVCFFLQSSLNGIRETENILKDKRFEFGVFGRKKLFFEELIVFKVSKVFDKRNEND